MKTLLILILTSLAVLSVQAGVTNITVQFTVGISGAGAASGTNSSTIKFQQDGSNKDAKIVDGTVWAWRQYLIPSPLQAPGTNSLEVWLRDGEKARFTGYATAKADADNAVRKQKLNDLLTTQSHALNAGDFSSIDAIIAKWTAP